MQQFGPPPLLDGQPSDTWTVQQRFSFAMVDFKRGLPGAHHPLHDSLRWYLSLSSAMRLFFQFVFKVQYISTHHKKNLKRWSWFKLQLLLYTPYDYGLHQTVNIRAAYHLTSMGSYSTSAYYQVYSFGISKVFYGSVVQPFFCNSTCKQCF